jgi:raffinose synthase
MQLPTPGMLLRVYWPPPSVITTHPTPPTPPPLAHLQVCGISFLVSSRNKLCWMVPAHSSQVADLPRHIQFMLVELQQGGPYAIVLPLLPNMSKAALQPAR